MLSYVFSTMIIRRLLISFIMAMYLFGCAISPSGSSRAAITTYLPKSVDLTSAPIVKKLLYSQLKEWRRTKYKLGGLTKKGIDCSGLVYVTFRTKFGIKLPRTTEFQVKVGKGINKYQLRPGDLVFFKTGVFTRHVGIYIENNKFIHASTSKGVTLSSLDNYYWSKKYWKSVRVSNRGHR